MYRTLRYTCSLLVLLPLAGPARSAEQGNKAFRVDGEDAQCNEEKGTPFCTLGAAIRAANGRPGPDTIDLAEGQIFTMTQPAVKNVTEGDTGLPAIASDVTLHGHGATV